MELTKTPKIGCLLNLKCEDPFLVWVFEVGKQIFNPNLSNWENPPLIWATVYAISLNKDTEDESFFVCFLFL